MKDAKWVLNLRTDEAKAEVHQNIFSAFQEVFELDIKPEAVRNSPKRTGTNARSIDTEVVGSATGVKGSIYTQSGYGGYVEVGTGRMAAQPYIYPAFIKFQQTLTDLIREKNNG